MTIVHGFHVAILILVVLPTLSLKKAIHGETYVDMPAKGPKHIEQRLC